ncbi:TauD/TfdA family dioxygenase [Streptomyces acidiscabies]|uniref:TauD/TfdA family dioxygenase n=1 Tax=Streptomyces acidiscabies TaxID=42234 RepID=UPI000952754A|nr:TauD/TfdA family dioxygenase [Streptomyces acidiscabies]
MTTVPLAYRVLLPDQLVDLLGKHLVDLPEPELDPIDGKLSREAVDRYRAVLGGSPAAWAVVQHLRDLLDDDQGDGFAVLTAAPLLDHHGFDDALKAVTVILSWLATPVKAYDSERLWSRLDAEPEHAAGASPLHIDAINAVRPPDYTAFLCVRPDPRGGGLSLVSPIRRAVSHLTDDERLLLADRVYRFHGTPDTTGTGSVLNTFPVLDDNAPSAENFVRFDPRMLNDADRGDPHTSAARALERELITRQRRLRLGFGDILIINLHLCASGHGALGGFQKDIPEEQRRQLRQIYLRTSEPIP